MTENLAVISPNIGVHSETFIKRHIEDLSPLKTVAVTHWLVPPEERTWQVSCPLYCTRFRQDILALGVKKILRLLQVDRVEYIDMAGVAAFLSQHNVKVILGEYLHTTWPFIKLAREMGIRLYAHAYGNDLSCLFRPRVWRRRYAEYQQAEGVIVLNRIMRDRLLYLGISPNKIHIIPCGVEVPDTCPQSSTGEILRCLAVGRMVGKKAPLKLLEAFRLGLQQFPDIQLDYVGGGPLRQSVEKYIAEFGLQKQIILHGPQPHERVQDLMQKADIFLQHSIVDPRSGDEEGLPVAIQEAMASGLPVIATRHAGIPEAVIEGETGLLVDEGDAVGMAKALVLLAENVSTRQDMGRKGWARAREKFTWQKEKSELLRVMGLNDSNGKNG